MKHVITITILFLWFAIYYILETIFTQIYILHLHEDKYQLLYRMILDLSQPISIR